MVTIIFESNKGAKNSTIYSMTETQGHSCIISKDSGEKWALLAYD